MQDRRAQIPEWAREILELRKRLGLSQAGFGRRLHYSPVAVSRWEQGAKEPTAESYVRLGNLAGAPECWSFWSRAGLRLDSARKPSPARPAGRARLPEFEIVIAGGGKRASRGSKKMEVVAIPVLPVHAATPGEIGDPDTDLRQIGAEAVIAAPPIWNPNAADTSCLRVKGSSMSPSINDGDLVAVDASQNDTGELSGKIVVVSQREQGLLLGRFRVLDGTQILESENRDYEPLVLGTGRNWKIIGKVVWLFRQTP